MSNSSPAQARRLKNAVACRQWLAALGDEPAARVALFERLEVELDQRALATDLRVEWFETGRLAQLKASEQFLQGLSTSMFPLSATHWEKLNRVVQAWRLGAERFERLHVQLSEDSVPSGSQHAESVDELQQGATTLPLLRALDLRVRCLRQQLVQRIEVTSDDWLALARLSNLLRAARAQDAILSDSAALIKEISARALFAYPVLLEAAQLTLREPAEIEWIDKLARNWAGKVSFRLHQDGLLRDNPHGPTVALSDGLSVRLDTHRLWRRLDEHAQAIESAPVLGETKVPVGLTRDRALRLLASLRTCWSDAYRPLFWVSGELEPVRLRYGMPGVGRADAGFAEPALEAAVAGAASIAMADAAAVATGLAGGAYVYGREEHDTLIRHGMGLATAARDAVDDYLSVGVVADRLGSRGESLTIGCRALTPVKAGVVVALVAVADAHATEFRLGWVSRQQQRHAPQAGALTVGQRQIRVGVSLWPVTAQLVGLRVDQNVFFEDVFFLPASDGQVASAVLAPGRGVAGGRAMLRLERRDIRIEFGAMLQRGNGFERVEIKLQRT